MEKLVRDATAAPGGRWVVAEVRSEADANAVREAADRLRGQLGRGAAVLALQGGGKLTFLAAVTDDLVAEKKLSAADLVERWRRSRAARAAASRTWRWRAARTRQARGGARRGAAAAGAGAGAVRMDSGRGDLR